MYSVREAPKAGSPPRRSRPTARRNNYNSFIRVR